MPDVAWIGGGGELAYWLQLKDLFKNYSVPYPVLVVRNSFLVVNEKYQALLHKLGLDAIDLFKGKEVLLNEIVNQESESVLNLEEERIQLGNVYQQIKEIVRNIDITLEQHVNALETKQMKSISALEKKMLRAEKRKFTDQKNQLNKLSSTLFPGNGLQERTENFMLFYSNWGNNFLKMLYESSLTLEQEFCIIEEP